MSGKRITIAIRGDEQEIGRHDGGMCMRLHSLLARLLEFVDESVVICGGRT